MNFRASAAVPAQLECTRQSQSACSSLGNLTTTKSSRCYDGYPKIVAGRRVLNIGELQCDPHAASKDSATAAAAAAGQSVTHGLLVVLILTVLAVGALVIYYHRKRMHDKLKPLVESLQKSMQYKTIEREDEQPEINV